MRILVLLTLLTALAAEEGAFAAYTVVYYTVEEAVENGEPVERTRSLILADLKQVEIGGASFFEGTIPDGLGFEASGGRVHIRAERVYLLMGSDSSRGAKVLSEAAAKGIWRQVAE